MKVKYCVMGGLGAATVSLHAQRLLAMSLVSQIAAILLCPC